MKSLEVLMIASLKNLILRYRESSNMDDRTVRVVDFKNEEVLVEVKGSPLFIETETKTLLTEIEGTLQRIVVRPNSDEFQGLVWLKVLSIEPGIIRAPRAAAPGTTVSMVLGDIRNVGSVCDLSSTGLRIRSLSPFEVGDELQCAMELPLGLVEFTARVARSIEYPMSESDIGVEIVQMSGINRARYDHYLESLLRRSRSVA
ncbi:hypothetical protein C0431_06540 [bacterium]|nr:hypothetical protein [bacterium]